MARNDPMMRFRAPEELRAKLEASAAESHRSLNAEIVQRLERSFARGDVKEVQEFALELLNASRLQRILSANLIVHMTNSIIENNYKIDGMSHDYLMRLRKSYSSGLGTEGELKETLTSFARLADAGAKNLPESILELLRHYGVGQHLED